MSWTFAKLLKANGLSGAAAGLVLLLSACNPLGGSLKDSIFQDGYQPGLPDSFKNKAPVASDGALTVAMNVATTGTLVATDENTSDTLTYAVVSQGSSGSVTITNSATGAYTYTPNASVTGSDAFTFKVSDGTLDSNAASVAVTIYDPNTPAVAANITPAVFGEDTQSVVTLSYADVDSDLATACTISSPTNVTVTQACACDGLGECTVGVTGTSNYFGAASFSYTVTTNSQLSNPASATLSITNVNDAPTISNIADTSTNEDVARAVTFTIADAETAVACNSTYLSMVSGTTSVVASASVVWSGTAPSCTATITPVANAYGTSTLAITVTDTALTANDSFVLTVSQLSDDAFTGSWPFDALSTALYSFSASVIQFTSGIAELIGTDQTDNTSTEFSTTSGGSLTGVAFGTLADGTSSGLKLGNDGTCNGSTTNCANQAAPEIYELHSSWTPQWASLVSYWKMNETSWNGTASEVVDFKGSIHGTSSGGATTTSSSKVGSHGGNFDGSDDFISVPHNSNIDLINTFTLAGWIQRNTSNTQDGIIEKYNWAAGLGGYGLRISSGNKLVAFVINNQVDSACTGTTNIATGTWYHIAATFNKNTNILNIFLNGTLECQNTSATIDPATSTSTLKLGARGDDATERFAGRLDDLAIWSTDLSAPEVAAIYSRQSARYSGTFTSRVMDAIASTASWTTLSWVPTLPFFKELPDAACAGATCTHVNNEVATGSNGYTSLVNNGLTNNLMNGIVGLWHLNESSWSGTAAEVRDDSGRGNHGRASGGATNTTAAKLGKAGYFDGVNDHVEVTAPVGLPQGASARTVAAWIYPRGPMTQTGWGQIVTWGSGNCDGLMSGFGIGNGGRLVFWGGCVDSLSSLFVVANTWNFVAYSYDGNTVKIYLNNQFQSESIGALSTSSSGPLYIGFEGNDSDDHYHFAGSIDEVGIWSRALNDTEMKQLYQRGASRLKHQVRTCATNPCTTETWKGPDGTSGTYFSELNNNSVALDGSGDVKATLPSMLFSAFTSPPSANQYFQYRTIFETDSSDVALGPELKSVTVDPVHYPSYLSTDTSPGNTIIGVNGVPFYDLSAFTQTLGATNGCASGVVYNIGLSSTGPWKYWTGAAWATSNGSSAQANTAATINTNAATFGSSVGRGSVYFKAFMQSSGTSKCELDNIAVGGNR